MHKSVRYYITESNDQPVVRSVQIAARQEPVDVETQIQGQHPIPTVSTPRRISRRRLTSRLKPGRSTDTTA
ncbi:MAG: hypothetical protein IT335_06525 [Thermomicrobiales bacterium]|jgi:hypothetical protein|nr:hypothetical protein [Thermomicrobiales bacterium]